MDRYSCSKNEPKTCSSQGFTLVELLIAVLIFSIGIVGLNRVQNASIRGNAYSMQLSEATNVAKSTAEKLMDLPQTSNTLGGTGTLTAPVTLSSPAARPTNTDFYPSWTVSQYGSTGLRQVTLNVTWNDMGIDHGISFTFFKGQ